VLDHRIVDPNDSLAGRKSLRAMADECGPLDFCRYGYYIARRHHELRVVVNRDPMH
jgi:hypothetical protein